jgi:hypothetical protein
MHTVYKLSSLIVLLLSFLVVSQGFAGPLPVDRMSVYFSREQGNLEEILVSLYARGMFQRSDYPYTDPLFNNKLLAVKQIDGKPHVEWKEVPG